MPDNSQQRSNLFTIKLSDFYAPYYPQYLFNIASQIILPNHDALLYNAFDLKTGDNAFLFVPFKLIPDQTGIVEFCGKKNTSLGRYWILFNANSIP